MVSWNTWVWHNILHGETHDVVSQHFHFARFKRGPFHHFMGQHLQFLRSGSKMDLVVVEYCFGSTPRNTLDSIMGLNKFVCVKAFKISVKQGSFLLLVQSLTWALGLPNQGCNWLWCCQQIHIRLTRSTLTGSGFLRLLLAAHAACGTSECL